MKPRLAFLVAAVASALALAPAGAAPAPQQPHAAAPQHIATVNGRKVSVEEFERTLGAVMRQKYYHRTPPEGGLAQVRQEVADSLVDRALLIAEAEKRGLPVDEDEIRKTLDGYEERYGKSPAWKTTRERALPQLKRELREQQQLARIQDQVRAVPEPTQAEARAFHAANPALFTEPERVHVSVILLKVDPSAPKAVRDKAREEGRDLRARLAKGADFAEMARIHSADGSAAKGGDLGYLHRGMLGEALHTAIDALKPGEVSPAVDVLEGVAVFKLHERTEPKPRAFADVKARAAELLKRERADNAWKDFVARLRRDAVIQMEPSWTTADAKKAP